MQFSEVLESRFSVRRFDRRPVEEEKIQSILNAAKIAPSACNYQPQRIFVLQSEAALKKFKECSPCHFDAPLAFLICYDKLTSAKRETADGYEFGDMDASIATTYMMLEAVNQGLGTTWVGYFDQRTVKQIFALDDNLVPVAFLPIGYPKQNCKPHPWHEKRKPLEETVKRI